MYTATITDVTHPTDTITIFKDGSAIFEIYQTPTGNAKDYEDAIRKGGFTPVGFDGTNWLLEPKGRKE